MFVTFVNVIFQSTLIKGVKSFWDSGYLKEAVLLL